MKINRINWNYTALRPIMGLSPAGDVPSTQKYDSVRHEYVPDYTLTPLVLNFNARVLDKDGIMQNGACNARLGNVNAYINIDGDETLIVTGSDYEVITSGEYAGRVIVKRNLPKGKAVVVRVEAELPDTRTGQNVKFVGSASLFCNVEELNENMFIEGGTTVFNPLKMKNGQLEQPEVVVMRAHHRCGEMETEPDADALKFIWQLKREDGEFTEVGSSLLDYFCEVSGVSGELITIDRSKMRHGYTLRCYALFAAEGSVKDMAITPTTPCETVSCLRKLPKIDYEPVGLPQNIPPGQLFVYPSVSVRTSRTTIENVDEVFNTQWYAAVNTQSANESFRPVANGASAQIDTTMMNSSHGMVVGVELVDAGPRMPAVDTDGAIITDSDGSIILW